MARPLGYADWRPRQGTRHVLAQVGDVLDEYRAQWPLTVRQVFYRLVGAHGFPKREQDYKRLTDYLNRARRAGLVPWEAIRDDGASSDDPSWRYTDAEPGEWLRWRMPGAGEYALHPQQGQPVFTEVWCEAAGMVPMLARTVRGYGVPVFSGGGFDSVTTVREHAQRIRLRDEATRVLYVGDHDPSGAAMYERLRDDVTAFGGVADWRRVAVLPEHIAAYSLPTAPPKATDKRGAFTDAETVQAEALPPDVLTGLVADAVAHGWDESAAEAVQREQAAARETLTEALAAMRGALDEDEEDDRGP